MDPDATLRLINEFLVDRDTVQRLLEGEEVDALCQDLFDWIARGGFPPKWDRYPIGTEYYRGREIHHERGGRV